MKNKIVLLIKLVLIIIVIISLVFSCVMSVNVHNIDCCEEEHCILCEMIHVANNIIKVLAWFILFIFYEYIYIRSFQKNKLPIMCVEKWSLVKENIVLNE